MAASVLLAAALLPDVNEAADHYTIDSARTVVSFEVRSFGLFRHRGGFCTTLGNVSLDPDTGEGSFSIVIDARSVYADNEAVQRIVRAKGFLDVDRYPNISYEAQQVIFSNGVPIQIEGELTLLGVSRAVPLSVGAYRCTPASYWTQQRCAMDASAEFKRSEFGMTGSMPFAGDRIKLLIHAEATASPSPVAN